MKKTLLTIFASFTMAYSYGQNTFPSSGPVGIGTTSPAYDLDVVGTIRASSKVITPAINNQYIGFGINGQAQSFAAGSYVLGGANNTGYANVALGTSIMNADNMSGFTNFGIGQSVLNSVTTGYGNTGIGANVLLGNTTGIENISIGNESLRYNVTGSGSVAIGTVALALSTAGKNTAIGWQAGAAVTTGIGNTFLGFYSSVHVTGSNNTIIGGSAGYNEVGITSGSGNTILGSNVNGLSPTLTNHIILADGVGHQRLVADDAGNIGIGTGNPDAKLTVAGTIHSSEVKVDTSIPTPDYVFNADYELMTLQEVEKYIDKNHHLPEIPSAAQFAKEGINLGEMNTRLLKKIEELTLYLIEKEQQLKTQDVKLTNLNIVLDKQQNQIETIMKTLESQDK